MSKPVFFDAGEWAVELRENMNGTTGSPYLYYRLVQLSLGFVPYGSLIDVVASCQISSKNPYNLMVASAVIMHETAGNAYETSLAAWGGQEICEAVGTNIDNNVHHLPIQRADKRLARGTYGDAHITLITYAASTAYKSGDIITVDKDYGSMSALVHPPGSFTVG
jgi:hypothetical protein